ncbi:MAG: hypothetical protein HY558_05615 [Euryarchaeota archaeon]|nr:hypothetical protein [Euryarchaeota archaeon]
MEESQPNFMEQIQERINERLEEARAQLQERFDEFFGQERAYEWNLSESAPTIGERKVGPTGTIRLNITTFK